MTEAELSVLVFIFVVVFMAGLITLTEFVYKGASDDRRLSEPKPKDSERTTGFGSGVAGSPPDRRNQDPLHQSHVPKMGSQDALPRSLGPPSPEAELLMRRGRELLNGNNWPGARDTYQKLLAVGGDTSDARYGLGVADYHLGDLEIAEYNFAKSVELDPSNANACYYLGQVAEQRHDLDGARRFYEKTLDLNPTHQSAFARLRALGPTR